MSNNGILNEIASNVTNWESLSALLFGTNRYHFNDALAFFESITWLFCKEILKNDYENVIDLIEETFPHVALKNISFANLQLQTLMKNSHGKDLDIPKEIASRVSTWTALARVLNFEDPEITQMKYDYSTCFDRSYHIMEKFCAPMPINNTWPFWKIHLSKFIEGTSIITQLETVFPQLINYCTDSRSHFCISNGDGLYFHQHMGIKRDEVLPIDDERLIAANIGGGGVELIHYQNYKEFVKTKQEYFDRYEMFMDMFTFDFTQNKGKACPILQVIQHFLEQTKDHGFAYKGYSLRNHYSMFGKYIFPPEDINENILAYFAKDNILLHLKVCNDKDEISKQLNNFSKEVQFSHSIHDCIQENPVIHMGIILIDDPLFDDESVYKCHECIEEHLMLPKSIFYNINTFNEWYTKIVKQNKSFEQIKNQVMKFKEIKTNDISKELKKNIIAQMALKSVNLPSFTPLPDYQIQELEKLVLLSPCQFQIFYSSHKHILIRGGYGSGKSLILQQKLEQILKQSDDNEIFYVICHDQMSKFAEQIKLLKEDYPEKCILVCNMQELTQWNTIVGLFNTIKLLKSAWKNRTVHILIDEFNGASLNVKEIYLLRHELVSMSDSHIIVAAQSMEFEEISDKTNSSNFQYEKLAKETSFELYELDYSLRCSLEISKFVNSSIDILNAALVSTISRKYYRELFSNCMVDREYGMQNSILYNSSTGSASKVMTKYKFNKPKAIGHNVSCCKVQIFLTDEISNLENKNQYDLLNRPIADYTDVKSSELVSSYVQKSFSIPIRFFYHINLILFQLMSLIEEKFVVCTFDRDIYNNIYHSFEEFVHMQWTTKVDKFVEKDSPFKILLTDNASVRGFEFASFIFVFGLNQEFMNYRIIETCTRATTNLYLIVHPFDMKLPELFECWKSLDCVNWKELSFNEEKNVYFFKSNEAEDGNGEEVLLDKLDPCVATNLVKNKYPWKNETVEHPDDIPFIGDCFNDVNILLKIIFSNDDVNTFKEFIKVHSVKKVQDYINSNGETVLHEAARYNACNLCKILIQNNPGNQNSMNEDNTIISIDCKDNFHQAPLHYAAKENSVDVINVLLENNAQINIKDIEERSPLHIATEKNSEDVLLLLLNRGANINCTDKKGKAPIHYAVEKGYENVFYVLHNYGADVHCRDKSDRSTLHYAAENDQKHLAYFLIFQNVDVDCKDWYSNTPLHLCARYNSVGVINILLDSGASSNRKNRALETPLHLACQYDNEKVAKIIINHGADVNINESEHRSPLYFAVENNNVLIATLLLDHYADVNQALYKDRTALHFASIFGSDNVAVLLLKFGADVNMCSVSGDTPLHDASRYGNKIIALHLIEKGANVNAINEDGKTPLHNAAQYSNESIVLLLIKSGANINVTDKSLKTPLHYATECKNDSITAILLDHGADVNITDINGKTPV